MPDGLELSIMLAIDPEAQAIGPAHAHPAHWRLDGSTLEELEQLGERGIGHEDERRRVGFQVPHDSLDPRPDPGVGPVEPPGIVFEERVGEEVPGHVVEPGVDQERALPAPDEEPGVRDARRPSTQVASHLPEDHPLPAPLEIRGQLLGGDHQVVAHLDLGGFQARGDQPEHRDQADQQQAGPERSPGGSDGFHGIGQSDGQAEGQAGRRQEVIVLPEQARKGDLDPGAERPDRRQPPSRARSDQEPGHRGDRRQPGWPASRPPPDQVIRLAERPGEPTLGIGIARDPPDQLRGGVRVGDLERRQRRSIADDVVIRRRARPLEPQDADRDRPDDRETARQCREVLEPRHPSRGPTRLLGQHAPIDQEQGQRIDRPVGRGHLLDQARRADEGAGQDDPPSTGRAQRPDHRRQRGHGKQVEEVLHVRPVAEQVRVGAQDRVSEGRDAAGGRPAKPDPDPPDQRDRSQDVRDRHQADRRLVRPADPDGQGVQPVTHRRLVLGEVAIEHRAVGQPPADVGVGRLVAVEGSA